MAKNKKAKNSRLNSSPAVNMNKTENVSEGKKYAFTSGVKVPNMKEILAAASDFDSLGVADIEVNVTHDVLVTDDGKLKAVPQGFEELQRLGNQVAESEERAREERKRMLQKAVSIPQSVEDLRAVASSQLSDERRATVEREMRERIENEELENAKIAARAERRKMQQRAVVDLLIKKENNASVVEKTPEETTEVISKEVTPVISTVTEDFIAEEINVEEQSPEELVADENIKAEPSIEEPTFDDFITEVPVIEEPSFEDLISGEPVVNDSPVIQEPIIEEPTFKDLVAEVPVVEETAVLEPILEDFVSEGNVSETQAVEEPTIDETVVEEKAIEEPIKEPQIETKVEGFKTERFSSIFANIKTKVEEEDKTEKVVPVKKQARKNLLTPEASNEDFSDMSIEDFFASLSDLDTNPQPNPFAPSSANSGEEKESAPEINSDVRDSFSDFL